MNRPNGTEPILEIRRLSCGAEYGVTIFDDAELTVNDGDVIILQGKSGSGKTTLLKCIAHLNLYEGEVSLHGKSPKSYGIPAYRIKVAYIPQRPSILPGTPRDFLNTIKSSFKTRRKSKGYESEDRPIEVAQAFGVEADLWDRSWSNLSGGEVQRIALAIGIGLGTAEVLLLDEPTSALDPQSADEVEKYILGQVHDAESPLKAVIWITHSPEQAERVGKRFVKIIDGKLCEDNGLDMGMV
ncbi:hypothetical protein V5O48_000313 [Marasmius crinis-equi]|uniref:ABC transporter domain-containing protein n=1 Tax=Marasmius crinis-equi TaxID=585013 RepID=A0ABR3G244_9AGAR